MRVLEEELIDAFIVSSKRERYKTLLASRRRRGKILDGLNHLQDLDPKYATEVPFKTDVASLLRDRGAPERCHVISDAPELDGREMPLEDAIGQMEECMLGTIVGCIPGRLGYYYGEAGERRVLLERGT
jgi:hypothetical protein